MPVSQKLAQSFNQKFGTPIPKVATSSTPKEVAKPSSGVWDALKNAPAAAIQQVGKTVNEVAKAAPAVVNKAAEIVIAQTPKREDMLKDALKTLSVEQRDALRKYAVPTKDGFMLPSVDDPTLGQFEGLKFTDKEWKLGFSAKYAQPSTISQASGKEEKIDMSREDLQAAWETFKNSNKLNPIETTLSAVGLAAAGIGAAAKPVSDAYKSTLYGDDVRNWLDADSQDMANTRRLDIARKEQEEGFDYLAKLRASRPTDEQYQRIDWTNPLTYGNEIYRAGKEGLKAGEQGWIEAKKNFGGFLESVGGSSPYFKWADTLGRAIADDARIELLKRRDLNADISIAEGDARFGDLAYYTRGIASTAPHLVGTVAATVIGAIAAGPVGAGATGFAYSASAESGSMYNQMLELGYSMNEARSASAVYGTISGALDRILPGEIGGRLVTPPARQMVAAGMKEAFKKELLDKSKKIAFDALKEGSTEAAQELVSNAILRFYGENQDIWENLTDSFVVGGLVGGLASAAESGANANRGEMVMPETTNDDTNTPQPATPDDIPQGPSVQDIEKGIDDDLQQAAAYTATVQMGEQLIKNGVPAEAIEPFMRQARERLEELNNAAQVETVRYAEATKEPVIQNENVTIEVGNTPTGEYVASGSVDIGNQSATVPFDIDNVFPTKEEAVADTAAKLEKWTVEQLGSEGVSNNAAMQNVVESFKQVDAVINTPTEPVQEVNFQELDAQPIESIKAAEVPKAYYINRVATKLYEDAQKPVQRRVKGQVVSEPGEAAGMTLSQFKYRNRKKLESLYAEATASASPEQIEPNIPNTEPIQDEGTKAADSETGKLYSRVSERMAEEYSEITPETYERIGIKDEIEKAVAAMEKDKEQTYRDAMGVSEIPEYERAAKNIAMTEKALEEGNFELAAQLIKSRSLRATELGQAIVMEKASVTDNSPQKYMRELIATRMQQLGEKYTSSLSDKLLKKKSPLERGQAVLKEQVSKAKKEISPKKKLDIQSAQDFIKSLQCN